jgi:membrane-bound ClpP family serine protease
MTNKMTNDAAAYLRSLAQLRGRDPDFAERAVREAASLSAEEALKAGVIEFIAADLPDLLRRVDGREVKLDSGNTVRLATAGAQPDRVEPDWRNRLLAVLSNPQLALVLVIGGADIFRMFMPIADRAEVTEIHAAVEGDTVMPPIDHRKWCEAFRETHPAAGGRPAFSFVSLARLPC